MGLMKMMGWLPVLHEVATAIDKANADGKITYAEAVAIAAGAAQNALAKLGIADKALVEDASDG